MIKLNNNLIIMIHILCISKFNCNLLSIFILKKNIEMHILIQNNTAMVTKIFKN